MKKKVLLVVGTRPNFIKITRFKTDGLFFPLLDIKIVHTGQHYDSKMADVFFEQFNLVPDFFLNISPSSANTQIAEIMIGLEKLIINDFKADLIIVVGDVNSTLAAALTANKLEIKLAHIESGLRSFDNTMPEEHNRILTDKLSDLFFVTEKSGYDNLKKDHVSDDKILFSGNTMIDTLLIFSNQIETSKIIEELKLNEEKYILMTMHRSATVDNKKGLIKLLELIQYLNTNYKIVFPIHPRTLKKIEEFGLKHLFEINLNLILTDPLDYFSFQKLVKYSQFILTDSGGIQEESTFVGIPCLTLRPNTERPITVTEGTNTLVPFEIDVVKSYVSQIESGNYKSGKIPKFWDGKSTYRILEFISELN